MVLFTLYRSTVDYSKNRRWDILPLGTLTLLKNAPSQLRTFPSLFTINIRIEILTTTIKSTETVTSERSVEGGQIGKEEVLHDGAPDVYR